MSNQKDGKLSRRDFVKVTALGVGATTLFAGLDPRLAMAKLPKKWDQDADVVIVGAGGAGLAAAVQISGQK